MIHEKEKRATCIRRKRSNARLKRRNHALGVVRIEDYRWQGHTALDLLTVMAHDNDRMPNLRTRNCFQYVFDKCSAPKWEKSLRPAHPLGFARGENDG